MDQKWILMSYLNSLEQDKHISSGIRYEDALQYDLIDIAMKWCQCETEGQCKEFIEIS